MFPKDERSFAGGEDLLHSVEVCEERRYVRFVGVLGCGEARLFQKQINRRYATESAEQV